mgnify:CR=1 FL=1
MDPKQKLMMIACGAGAGLVVVALGALLVVQIGAMNEARQSRDDAADTLNTYNQASVYPSDANRKVREEDAARLLAWGDAAKAQLAQSPEAPKGESPSQFANRLSETIRGLNERQGLGGVAAKPGDAEGPLDYSFGRYVTQNEMPKEGDVPRLVAQFAVIEHVCALLLDNGAQRILQVTREPFDAAQAKPQEEERPSRTSRRRGRTREEERPLASASGAAVDPALAKDGVTCERYTIRFRARYTTLAKVLDALVQDKYFVVVTDLSVTKLSSVATRVEEMIKARQNARAAARRTAARNAKKEAAATAAQEEEKALFEGVSPSGRLVTDPANAIPLDVTLTFDVYSVPPPPAAEEAAATDKEGK